MNPPHNVIAVLPARAGSQGIPGKNTLLLGGRPILHYTLDCIAESALVTHTVAITNDPLFRRQAEQAGLLVLEEPEWLARDDVPIGQPIAFAVEACERTWGLHFDFAIQCEVSTPIRPPHIIDDCLELLLRTKAQVATAVEPATRHPPQWTVRREEDGRIRFGCSQPPLHRQEMDPLYHLGGALAVFRRDVVGVPNWLTCDCAAVAHPAGECIYLDEPFDVEMAEFLLERRRRGKVSPAGKFGSPEIQGVSP